ncbi:non-ribosomal peptide synthetase [Cognataquiflexum rubidum]|uniref:non-ribosomal peptide synthetase n=1 Tax=Cognataquiflexum rubidum TaxID=2922273 RepID=UPI001F12E8C6|nr:non-ribosomal peptide synthetase [Cognataquiflexum rubidum]MCH6234725.1 amino acid adenylation domain-containing protein [Cognataquiflexum rubidum]
MSVKKSLNNQSATGSSQSINGYWIKKLEGIKELQLPKDPSKSLTKGKENNTLNFFLDKALLHDIKASFSEKTPSSSLVLFSALKVLIYRYSSQNDFCVGKTIKKSGLFHPSGENEQNDFLDILPIRSKIDGSMQFGEFVQKLGADLAEANSYNQISVDQLISSLGIKNKKDLSILFPVIFDYQKNKENHEPNHRVTIKLQQFNSTLFFGFVENDDTIDATITFDTELYCFETIQRMASHFLTVLESVQSNPSLNLGLLNIIPDEEDFLLKSFTDTESPLSDTKTILDLFEQQVINNPNALAVEFEGKELSYSQLDAKSNQLAHFLIKNGLKPESPVPICMDRSLEMIIGIFGILKSGGAYVPIDPAFPKDRIDYMIEDTKADFVICSSGTAHNFSEKVNLVIMDQKIEAVLRMPSGKLPFSLQPENLAYIIYTSGSTGKPKGAMVDHENLINFSISLTKIVEYDSSSRQLSVTPFIFDAFCLELFVPLINGGSVFLVKKEIAMDGFSLSKKLAEVRPTHMQATPSGWQLLLSSGWNNPEGIIMTTGGEALMEETKNLLAQTGKLWNLYGPTETTITSTFKKMEVGEKVSIGKPIDNTSVYILGPDGGVNPIGIPGELYIGGKGVGRGYLNKPDLTSQKFLHNPFSNVPGDRMYRTGDLARWLPEGNIEYLGRMDDQVKIRGYRIELGEIESVLLLHPIVKQAVVIAKEYGQGDKRLVGYVVCEGDFNKESVIAFLRSKLPECMVPTLWLQLEKLPLSFTGKIDRKALPDVGSADMVTARYAEPKNDLEKQLAALWQKLLGLDRVGIHDDFFALGGHSLLAMRTLAAVRKDLGAELSIRELFSAPTVAQLALILQSRRGEVSSNVPHPVARPEDIPLSYNQQSLWFIHQLEGSIQYHIPQILDIDGNLDITAIDKALKTIVNRHEVLRTVVTEKDGNYWQKVLGQDLWKLDRMDLPEPELLDNEISGLIRTPFDLTHDHMMRACLITKTIGDYCLVITMHHIASDGWSANILRKELTECYQAITKGLPIILSPLSIQYIDYAIWQRNFLNSDSIQPKIDYWKARLKNIVPLQLPTDFSRPSEISRKGGTARFSITKELISDLNRIGLQFNATLFMTLISAFKVLMYRYTGQEDICVGTPVAGRNYQNLENLIGFFVNSIPLRNAVEGKMRFEELLKQVRTNTLDAFDNSEIPFEQMVESLEIKRDLSKNPVFQVLFALHSANDTRFQTEDTKWTSHNYNHSTSRFDFAFELTEAENGLDGIVEFSTDLFLKETIERMVGHYKTLLYSISENPSNRIDKLKMIGLEEDDLVLRKFNNTKSNYPKSETIVSLFEKIAKASPNKIAVVAGGQNINYKELDGRANQFANYLILKGVKSENPIPLCIDRSIEMVIGILGILKAGGALVPIDPSLPVDRIDYMLEDTGADFVICISSTLEKVSNHKKLLLDQELEGITLMSSNKPLPSPKPENLFDIIYTSGSTGRPKGVMVEHRNLVNFLFSMSKDVDFNPSSSILSVTTYSFDIFYLELFLPLFQGGCVILADKETTLDGYKLAQLIEEKAPTHMQATPSGWQLLLESGWKNPTGIKMLVGGEALKEDTKNALSSLGTLWNLYGPTETTIWSTLKKMDPTRKVNIGKPIANTSIYILGSGDQANPIGIPGELCIGGDGVGRGYLNRPELTSEKFVRDPFSETKDARFYRTGDLAKWLPDGNIEYLGRIDDQVKIRGHRIELGEIETVLQQHKRIKQAVVAVKQDNFGINRLIGYVICKSPFDKDEVISFLNAKLPEYMVPHTWMELDAFPLTFNGKINRKALPEPVAESNENIKYEAPKTDLQKIVSEVWRKILGVEKVGLNNDFFELGGHSLMAMRVIVALRQETGQVLSIRDLFTNPTLKQFTEILSTKEIDHREEVVKTLRETTEILPLSYNQQSLWFIHQLEGSIQYHIPLIFNISGKLNILALEEALKTIVNRHEVLRTVIREKDGNDCQTVLGKDLWKLERRELHDPGLLDREVTGLIRIPFDLTRDHMMRACIITLAPNAHCLVIILHHIASDGWSASILKKELKELYTALSIGNSPDLPELPYQYADYALLQRKIIAQDSFQSKIDLWKKRLQDTAPLQLPTDFTRPSILSTNGDIHRFLLDSNIVNQLKELGKSQKVTLFMTLLAAYKILLYRYSGQEDICVGTPIAGRENKETEDLIGFFVNTLALRTQIQNSLGFDEFLEQVKTSTLEAFEVQQVPFEIIVGNLGQERDLSRNPIFQVLFVLQNVPDSKFEIEGAEVSEKSFEHFTSKFDMTFELTETNEGIEGVLEYCTDLFKKETITNFVSHYKQLLKSICNNPLEKIGTLEIIQNEESNKILDSFNKLHKPIPENTTILDLFKSQVIKSPDSIAVVFEGKKLSYSDLDKKSDQLSNYLIFKGIQNEYLIPICLDRSFEMIIGILAILKAGGAYVPVDPTYPKDRINYILADSAAKILLTTSDLKEKFSNSIEIICLDIDTVEMEKISIDFKEKKINQNSLAYVIYTSGSTGTPKGVLIEHKGLLASTLARKSYYDNTGAVLMIPSFAFDSSVAVIFGALTTGGQLILCKSDLIKSPHHIQELLKDTETILCVPSYYRFLQEEELLSDSKLSNVILAGENLDHSLVKLHFNKTKNVKLFNEYGPTEGTVWASVAQIHSPDENVTIGKPIDFTKIYILNKDNQLNPINVAGELCVSGQGVARGYLNNPELTSEKFVKNPLDKIGEEKMYRTGDLARWLPDGNIEYLGRIDDQVKIRGYRIELGEIEQALNSHSKSGKCVVIARALRNRTDMELIAYATGEATAEELRSHLKVTLPQYMVPNYYVKLASIPLTSNGKVDRKNLPDPESTSMQGGEYGAPRTDKEKLLVRKWSEVLRAKEAEIGLESDFFALGGDSIKAIQIVARLRAVGYELKISDVMGSSKLSEMATKLRALTRKIDQRPVEGKVLLSPIQRAFLENSVARGIEENKDLFHQSFMFCFSNGITAPEVRAIIEKLIAHHDVFRMRYQKTSDGLWEQYNEGQSGDYYIFEEASLPTDSSNTEATRRIFFEDQGSRLKQRITFRQGPLLGVGLYHDLKQNESHLLLSIHHMVIDLISWRILFEDIEILLDQYRKGEELVLPEKTDSYQYWMERNAEYTEGHILERQRKYWEQQQGKKVDRIAVQNPEGSNCFGVSKRVGFALSKEETALVQKGMNGLNKVEINALLLSALSRALKEVFGVKEVRLLLEGHGREDYLEKTNISRTVGWFTSIYPFVLSNREESIESVLLLQDALSQVPDKGVGFGLLRYLHPQQLPEMEDAQVAFNYFGDFSREDVVDSKDQIIQSNKGNIKSSFTYSKYEHGPDVHPDLERDSELEVSGQSQDGCLEMSIQYSAERMDEGLMLQLAASFKIQLLNISENLSNYDKFIQLPGSFTYKGLILEQIEALTSQYGAIEDVYLLSPMQQGLYYHALSEPESHAYFIQIGYGLIGGLDIEKLKIAFKRIIERHAVLRTVFRTDLADEPLQVVLKEGFMDFRYVDIREKEKSAQQEFIRQLRESDKDEGFDLSAGPLLRLIIIQLSVDNFYQIWSNHHLILDGWSANSVLYEFDVSYKSLLAGKQASLNELEPFSRYIAWLDEIDHKKSNSYWNNYLSGYNSKAILPFDVENLTRSTEYLGKDYEFWLDQELSDKIIAIASKEKTTLNTIIQSAWGILLSRYNNTQDVVFGSVVSGRPSQLKGVQEMIGIFINTVPQRVNYTKQTTFKELLQSVHHNFIEGENHHHLSLAEIQQQSELGTNLIDHLVIFENYPISGQTEDGTAYKEPKIQGEVEIIGETVEFFEQLNYDFTLMAASEERLFFRMKFNSTKYSEGFINRLAGHWEQLLEEIAMDIASPIVQYEIISSEEQSYLLETLNATQAAYPHDKTILDLFSSQALKSPDAVAVEFEGRKLSYKELDIKSNQLAHYLIRNGLKPESPVPICIDRSLEMVIGIFGVIKSSVPYVPIDPALPKDRIDYMVEDTKADFVICSSKTEHNFGGGISRVIIDQEMASILKMPSEAILNSPLPDNLAYIIYTSGSTGRPKGVMIEHRNVVNFLASMSKNVEFNASSSLLSVTTFSFDIFYLELFLPLINGGKVFLVSRETAMDGFSLSKKQSEVRPTHMQATPSGWQMLLNSGWNNPQNLKMLVGGEALGEELKNTLVGLGTLWNMYGPTETTIWSTYKKMEIAEKVTIGKPIDNTSVYILGPNGGLNPLGIPGELCIGGKGVGRGYLNRPELTFQKFLPDRFSNVPGDRIYRTGDLAKWLPDGNIEYLGRMDDQVKIRGYRMELGEIESVLLLHPTVKQAVVTAREYGQGDKRLVGYVVCDGDFDKESVSAFLRSKLPEYMVPALWLQLEKLPLTFSGKIDRKALPDVGSQDMVTANYTEPRSELEKKLATLWQRILGLERVGVHDDFFSIGGHSILAVKVISALEKEIGSKVAINLIFNFPSIFALAKALENPNHKMVGWNSLVPIKPTGNKPPLFIVHGVGSTVSIYYSLAKYMENDQPVYGFQPKGLDGMEVPNHSVEEMAGFYISLMIKQYPSCPYNIAGYSFGGYVAYEMARQLKAMGREVSKLILFDTSAYEDEAKLTWLKKLKLQLGKRIVNLIFAFKEPQGFYEQKRRSFDRKKDQVLIKLNLKARPETQKDQGSIIKVVAKNNIKILKKYKLNQYEGDLHLFKVKNRSFYVEDTKFYGWEPLVNQVHNVHVSGHHDNIFKKPEILREMAEKIQKVLDEPNSS